MSDVVDSCHFDGIYQQTYDYHEWKIVSRRSHILQSRCSQECLEKQVEESQLCLYCK